MTGRGRLKVGYTTKQDVWERIKQQTGTAFPQGEGVELLLDERAVTAAGRAFKDHEVHAVLRQQGIRSYSEVFEASLEEVKAAITAVRSGSAFDAGRTQDFAPRPEQARAVEQTTKYLEAHAQDSYPARFLWNAKMRFGKTFTAYQLALRMGWKRVLVLTYKPAVRNAWRDDLASHVDFAGWEYADRDHPVDPDTQAPLVRFASFQDLLHKVGGRWVVKEHIEDIALTYWDCVILDEYHYGAWQGAAKDVTSNALSTPATTIARAESAGALRADELADELADGEARLYVSAVGDEDGDQEIPTDLTVNDLKLTSKNYLYLSGTPFRALTEGEFNEDAIFNWTYPDEQMAKKAWGNGAGEDSVPNPYVELPQMQMFTYRLRDLAIDGEISDDGAFDLNAFFEARTIADDLARPRRSSLNPENYAFATPDPVGLFLNMLTGKLEQSAIDRLVTAGRPPFPYSDDRFAGAVDHTVWFLPTVASAYAMRNALAVHPHFKHFFVHVAAGSAAGMGAAAKGPVDEMVADAARQGKQSITLSVGKLMTGVTIPQWGAILILRGLKSPESYFQAAFRVQSPWTGRDAQGNRQILKDKCFVFDFEPQRALSLVYEYGTKLASNTSGENRRSPADEIADLVGAMPTFAFEAGRMDPVDVNAVMDWGTAGTGAAMLAKRWGSPRLINLSEDVLAALLGDEDLLAQLEQLEDFRNLREDAGKLLASSKKVSAGRQKAKASGEPEDEDTKRARKARREQRETLQKKLLKFVQTIPVFMYLTDFREEALVDVIRSLDTKLFERVTGLTVKDFDRLSEVGVFNRDFMNEAIWQFRLFERASLDYLLLGGDDHTTDRIGAWDTTATVADAKDALESL